VTTTNLTVTNAIAGSIVIGSSLYKLVAGISTLVGTINSQTSGTSGGNGVYVISASTTLASQSLFSGAYPAMINAPGGETNNRYFDASWVLTATAATPIYSAATSCNGDLWQYGASFGSIAQLYGGSAAAAGSLVCNHNAGTLIQPNTQFWPPAGVLATVTGTAGGYAYYTSGPCSIIINSGPGSLGNNQPVCVDYTAPTQASVPNALFPTTPIGWTLSGGTGTQGCMLQIGPFPILCGNPVNATVAAAGTNQATATVLVAKTNFVTSGTGGVSLAGKTAGTTTTSTTTLAFDSVKVVNETGGSINVYPPTGFGAQINSLGANVAYSLAAGASATFSPTSLTQFYTG
jgi:hypothetical protein